MNTVLQRWGNSQGIRIPKVFMESLGIQVGSELSLELADDNSAIIIRPAKDMRPVRERHRIGDLLASTSHDAFGGEYDWGDAAGKEVW